MILVGRIALKGFFGQEQKFDTLGLCKAGDTLGEEGVYEIGKVHRKETALAEEDTYVLEFSKE